MPDRIPFFADHVGSFARPAELIQAYWDHEDGKIDDATFRSIQDRNIGKIIDLQERAGLRSITDGEFRRVFWARNLSDAVDGLEFKPGPFTFRNDQGLTSPLIACTTSKKLKKSRSIAVDDFIWLKARTKQTPKVTLPTPSFFHFGFGDKGISQDVYPDVGQFFFDMINIYRDEITELGKQGCTYVQLDEVPLALLCDSENQQVVRQLGDDPQRLIDLYVDLVAQIAKNRPKGMTMCLHLCRGNRSGLWAGAGGYEPIAERLFNKIDVDGYFLEYDNSRAGDFSPLRHVPKGKAAILGLVSTKSTALEDPNQIRSRINEATRYLPLDQLGISPQCGFGSSASRYNPTQNPMTPEITEKKLRLLVDIAADVWR